MGFQKSPPVCEGFVEGIADVIFLSIYTWGVAIALIISELLPSPGEYESF
ncbi:MAG: hypothetical protein ACRC8Y_00230 [Chroococcales cyanobacterium]